MTGGPPPDAVVVDAARVTGAGLNGSRRQTSSCAACTESCLDVFGSSRSLMYEALVIMTTRTRPPPRIDPPINLCCLSHGSKTRIDKTTPGSATPASDPSPPGKYFND